MKIWVIRRRTLRMALLIAVGAVLAAVLGTSVVRRAVPAAASAARSAAPRILSSRSFTLSSIHMLLSKWWFGGSASGWARRGAGKERAE